MPHTIEQQAQGNFTWLSATNDDHRPIDTLAEHGFLRDNGLLSNKIISEYGQLVFKDKQARMYHTELKTKSGEEYRRQRSYWQAFKDLSKRTEPSNLDNATKKEKAIYTERELAERMIKIIRFLQPIEALLNRPDLSKEEITTIISQVQAAIETYKSELPAFKFKDDLPGLDGLVADEERDLKELSKALDRLKIRVGKEKDKNKDINPELQKWLVKRFDQLNRGFEVRVRNLNIYKAPANTGGLTLGRAYDTIQNVKKLFRLTGHYYAEAGLVTPEMQHRPDKTQAGFNSELYPLQRNSGDDHGNALKIAHLEAANGDYAKAQESYRRDKNKMLLETRVKPKRAPLTAIASAVQNFGASLKAKATEEMDFSFGSSWRSSTKLGEKQAALKTLTDILAQLPAHEQESEQGPESSLVIEEDNRGKRDAVKSDVEQQDAEQNSDDEADSSESPPISQPIQMTKTAYPSASLQLAAMGDIFTSTTKFTENFIEFFAEEMADKRPFIAVVAFSIYGLCGLTVFDPVMAKAVFGVATQAIEKLAASLAIQKANGSPIVLSPDTFVNMISHEATLIAEHLGSNASMGAKLVTSSLVNMQAYVFTADFLGLPTNESGFIRSMMDAAKSNPLTHEAFADICQKHGLTLIKGAVILGIGMAMGIFASQISLYGVPLDKVFELPLAHLHDPTLAPGAAFNASLITLKSVGAYYEAVYTAGSEVSKAGVPIENNDIDYAMLVMFLSFAKKDIDLDTKDRVLQNQLRRLLREYPGLIQHKDMKEVAEAFNCVPAKSSWPATILWGLIKPVVIAATWLMSIPRLIYHLATSKKDKDGYQSALRSFVRGPLAGWLVVKRVATTGITFGRMLLRLAIEVPYRFINKTVTLLDAAFTGIYKGLRKIGKKPEEKQQIAKDIEANYVHRCQNRNSNFVRLIGWLDDNIGKPLNNVLFRNAEQTTQLLLATGAVTRRQRQEMYQATLQEIESNPTECEKSTKQVFSAFNITRTEDKGKSLPYQPILAGAQLPRPQGPIHTVSLFTEIQVPSESTNLPETKRLREAEKPLDTDNQQGGLGLKHASKE